MASKTEYLYHLKLCVFWFLLVVAFLGCAGPRIIMKPEDVQGLVDDARSSVTLAKEAGAQELASEEIARAESLLARAEDASKDKKRGAETIRLASEARAKAESAYTLSRQTKLHEQEVQKLSLISSEKEQDIAELESVLKAARESEEAKAREAEVCARKIEQIEMEKEQELAAIESDLIDAEERMDRIQQEKEQELAAAISMQEETKKELEKAQEEIWAYSEKIRQIEEEKEQNLAAAKSALKAVEDDARKAKARVKTYSDRIAALERERGKEIAIHVAREDDKQKRTAKSEAEKKLLQGKPNLEMLEEVGKAVEGLRVAWQRRDLDGYMSYYAEDAKVTKAIISQGKETSQTFSKSELRNQTGDLFAQVTQFSIGEPNLNAGSDAVIVTVSFFKKQSPSSEYEVKKEVAKHEMWIKELLFRKIGGKWKIVNENWSIYRDIPEYAERR